MHGTFAICCGMRAGNGGWCGWGGWNKVCGSGRTRSRGCSCPTPCKFNPPPMFGLKIFWGGWGCIPQNVPVKHMLRGRNRVPKISCENNGLFGPKIPNRPCHLILSSLHLIRSLGLFLPRISSVSSHASSQHDSWILSRCALMCRLRWQWLRWFKLGASRHVLPS